MNNRQKKALTLLENFKQQDYFYLGQGATSVIFHDGKFVYKVFLLENLAPRSPKRHLLEYIRVNRVFEGAKFFYPIQDILDLEGNQIIVYQYEQSEPCNRIGFEEMENFLVECWKCRILFKDIKPKNFIRVNNALKFIDYDPETYTDNVFLNMVVRAFIYCKYSDASKVWVQKLCRTAINNFGLAELEGIQQFTNRIFARIIFNESSAYFPTNNCVSDATHCDGEILQTVELDGDGLYSIPYDDSYNPCRLFFDLLNIGLYLARIDIGKIGFDDQNHFSPDRIYLAISKLQNPPKPVSLVIKACTQDTDVVYEAVKHIVKQLASPNIFQERLLALDIRQSDFLRQYNSGGSWEKLLREAQRLMEDGIIHKCIYPSSEDIGAINQRWFGLETEIAHTHNKIPVAAQLYAFEQATSDYILQVDCDAMICRRNLSHSFLADMLAEIEKNESVLSVGFNICKPENEGFTPYFGFENGGFVPEVRFGLLHRKRIQALLPLPNSIKNDGLEYSWYRSLEIKQKESGTCSIRGGHSDSFYIHPPNFKKTDQNVWFTIVDRVEQLAIPACQTNEFDLCGSYYDWAGPKRNEPLVIVAYLRNISLALFLRFWYSLVSQSFEKWGVILVDDASDNGISHYIKAAIAPYQKKVTFIHNKFFVGVASSSYKAIHYFMQNEDSVVVLADGKDAFFGKQALQELFEKYAYWKGDVVVGKPFHADRLHAHYAYTPNFIHPRQDASNVWQRMCSFKKYLFDSLRFEDIKILNKRKNWAEGILLSKLFTKRWVFPEECWEHTCMIPIIEMSSNPKFCDYFNYYHDKDASLIPETKEKEREIFAEVLGKKAKSPDDVVRGRRPFLPNFNKIEIDITYECNLKCLNCNRSSTQAPTIEGMSLSQVQQFVKDSIALGKRWELINILGGEPTIHPQFLKIVDEILHRYIIAFSPETILQVTSNGFGELVQSRLKRLPEHPGLIVDYASFKDGRTVPYFTPFNDAPIDNPGNNDQEYYKGCWVTSYCGIGLNQLGYYPCGVAGGIDRVFRLNKGIQRLADVEKHAQSLLNTFCRYCGNFSDYAVNKGDFIPRNEKAMLTKPVMSKTWRERYKSYNSGE